MVVKFWQEYFLSGAAMLRITLFQDSLNLVAPLLVIARAISGFEWRRANLCFGNVIFPLMASKLLWSDLPLCKYPVLQLPEKFL